MNENRSSYPAAANLADGRRLLSGGAHAARLPDGVLLTRANYLPEVTGGELPLHMADQIGAFLRDGCRLPTPAGKELG